MHNWFRYQCQNSKCFKISGAEVVFCYLNICICTFLSQNKKICKYIIFLYNKYVSNYVLFCILCIRLYHYHYSAVVFFVKSKNWFFFLQWLTHWSIFSLHLLESQTSQSLLLLGLLMRLNWFTMTASKQKLNSNTTGHIQSLKLTQATWKWTRRTL